MIMQNSNFKEDNEFSSNASLPHGPPTMCVDFFIISSPELLGSQGELIVYPCSGVRPSSVHNFKHLLLRNRLANQSQILCGASLGRGNESLYKWSRSHDQDGCHAHIW